DLSQGLERGERPDRLRILQGYGTGAVNMVKTTAGKESTVKDFLEVIFRRKWIILSVVFIATSLVIFLNMREPAVFESSGKMLVRRGESVGVFNQYVRTLAWEEEIASQIEMVKSQVVIARARELLSKYLPEGYEGSENISYAGVQSGVITTSNVLWVSYSGMDPVFCEAAVNAIINSYKEYYQKVRTPPEMEDFFSAELTAVTADLEFWRSKKSQLEKEWGIVDIQHQVRNTLNRLEAYITELDEIQAERAELEAVIASLENFRELDVESLVNVTNSFAGSANEKTQLEIYGERLVDLKLEESKLTTDFTDEHKEVVDIRGRISDLYVLMEKEVAFTIEVQRKKLEMKIDREQTLKKLVSEMRSERNQYPEREIELDRINKSIKSLEEQLDKLQEQHMNAKITLASNPEWSVTILSPATRASQKKTRDYVRMALGPMFSLIIALGFAFFLDNLDHSLKNVSEAEEVLGFQVLSSFPDLDNK
ncbi:MAG TPA: hypothetical protein VLA34_03125, partial [Candidatus Krumholzibacterium sp.]|nr:hypothetical protein [Candidatus Krumholzibacterium sp.]